MSAGAFTDSIYQLDDGTPVNIRVQPETIANAWNTAGTGTPTIAVSARAGGGRRRVGINARVARFRWAATVPDGYDPAGVISLPILTKAKFDALVKNVDYPYLGSGLNLIGKTNESVR